ncbi:hypothetical protein KGA14_19455, partial [Klebsiella pneumoniae]|nr:hypothetical protein [Klebsiella pneumoniae]
MASGTELRLCRVAAAPYPAYNPKSPLAQGLLKLPVLAASTSLGRPRKAGAARMDAGCPGPAPYTPLTLPTRR